MKNAKQTLPEIKSIVLADWALGLDGDPMAKVRRWAQARYDLLTHRIIPRQDLSTRAAWISCARAFGISLKGG